MKIASFWPTAWPKNFRPAAIRSESFDHVLFSYSLSMIPDWRARSWPPVAALSADGRLHVVDFGDLTGLGWPAKGALTAWLRLFHVSPRVEFLEDWKGLARKGELTLLSGRYAFVFPVTPK